MENEKPDVKIRLFCVNNNNLSRLIRTLKISKRFAVKKVILLCVVFFFLSLVSMESKDKQEDVQKDAQQDGDDFIVYVLNLFGAPLNVNYQVGEQQLCDRVEHLQWHKLTHFKELADESKLSISRAGKIKQYLAASVIFLRNQISQLKVQTLHQDKIFVIHCYPDWLYPFNQIKYHLFCVHGLKPKRKMGSPFLHFPTIEQHKLEKKLTFQQVMQLKDQNETLSGCSAHDIARYILGLDQQFNAQDVHQKAGKLYAKWKPFEVSSQAGLRDTHILQTLKLIQKAKEILLKDDEDAQNEFFLLPHDDKQKAER